MKNLISLLLVVIFGLNSKIDALAQLSIDPPKNTFIHLSIKKKGALSSAYEILGSFKIDMKGFYFTPMREWKGKEFYSTQLLTDIFIDWKDVKSMKKGNTGLVFPDKIIIETQDGKRQIFRTFRRKVIINAHKAYLQAQR